MLSGRKAVEIVTQKKNTPPNSMPCPSPVKSPSRVTGNVFISPEGALDTRHQTELGNFESNVFTLSSSPDTSDQESLAKPLDLKIRKVVRVTRQGRKTNVTTAEVLIDVHIQINSSQELFGGRKRQLDDSNEFISTGAGKLPRWSP